MSNARRILNNFTAADNVFQSLGVRHRLDGCKEADKLICIPVERIEGDPEQPRKRKGFDEASLRRTGELMRSEGQLQPIRVRWNEARGLYRIVVEERRWRSAKLVGMTHVDAIVEPEDGENPLVRQIVENLCREDLDPIDKAESYRRLMDLKGWTAVQCADYLHIDPSTINSVMRLLDAPVEVQERLRTGEINQSQAIAATRSVRPKCSTAGRSAGRKIRRGRGIRLKFTALNGLKVTAEHPRKIDEATIRQGLLEFAGSIPVPGPIGVVSVREEGQGDAGTRGRGEEHHEDAVNSCDRDSRRRHRSIRRGGMAGAAVPIPPDRLPRGNRFFHGPPGVPILALGHGRGLAGDP